jgi:hypothetical protein
MLQVYDPTGLPPSRGSKQRKTLSTLVGAKVAFVWNQYASTTRFWPEFEKAIQGIYEPGAIRRIYKENTWSPAERGRLDELLVDTDYLVVGVGA